MTADALLAALGLPSASLVDQRVPKTLLVENGAPTAADRRQIEGGIEEIRWVATLKPTTVGVEAFSDATREYLEVQVLRLSLRAEAAEERLVEILHRAIPYPVLAVSEMGSDVGISAAHKRWAQNEAGRTVLDGEVVAASLGGADPSVRDAFAGSVALAKQPRLNLQALYQGWVDTIVALNVARRTGALRTAGSPEAVAARQEALHDCARLDAEVARLRGAASKERQMARQVELNLELKRAEAALAAARARL